MRLRRCRFILAVSSAISSSCFHCSFFSCDGHIAVVGAVKHSQQGLWPPSAPDPRGGSVVEPHSARQLLRTCQSPPNPFGFRAVARV